MLWCQAEITRRVIFAVLAILIYNSSYIHPQRYQWPCTVKLPSLRKIGSLPTRRLRFDSSHSAASQELPYRLQTAWEKTLQDALYSCSSIGHHNIIDKFFYPTPSLCETCVNRVRLWANLTISDFSVLGRLFIHVEWWQRAKCHLKRSWKFTMLCVDGKLSGRKKWLK